MLNVLHLIERRIWNKQISRLKDIKWKSEDKLIISSIPIKTLFIWGIKKLDKNLYFRIRGSN